MTQKRLMNTLLVSRPCGRADPLPCPKAPNPAPLTQSQPSSKQAGAVTTPVRHPPAQWRPGRCGLPGGHARRREHRRPSPGGGRHAGRAAAATPGHGGGEQREARGSSEGTGENQRKPRTAQLSLARHPPAASEGHRRCVTSGTPRAGRG